jgi:hypothetical protein
MTKLLLWVGFVALALCTIAAWIVAAWPAFAAPPAGADPRLAPWFEKLETPLGQSCCGLADCREVTRAKSPMNSPDGKWWVFIGKEQFGASAPDRYIPVPESVTKIDTSEQLRPPGPVVCWAPTDPFRYGAPSGPDGAIMCFRPPRAAG